MRRLFVCILFCTAIELYAQSYAESYLPWLDSTTVSAFEYATKIPKKSKIFNMNLEMHSTFNTFFTDKKLDEAAFRFNYINLEAIGEINNKLFYWYRQRLNDSNAALSLENLPESIDYALIGFNISDRFTVIAGKQDLFLGGYEYDLNPLEIYEYSDMNEYTDCYYTGVGLVYQITSMQELRFQVADNRIGSMEEQYGLLPEGIETSKAPLYYTLNWNGSFWDEQLNFRYSATAGEQAKKNWMYMLFAGNNVAIGGFDGYLDVMYSRGDIDQLGILSELNMNAAEEEVVRALNTHYLSFVTDLNYQWNPKWNVFVKGMYDMASVYKTNGVFEKGKYRTAWGYQGGIEFFPMADDNLHFFFTYTGRSYNLTSRAKALGATIDNTQRLSVGFIYKLPLF